MKRHETESTSPAGQVQYGEKRHAPSFAKVLDGRKRPVRGLWVRNGRYYARLTVTDPATGKPKVQRIPILSKAGVPVATVADAKAGLDALVVKRRDTGLEAQRGRAPQFAEYVDHYLDAIGAGAGAKKPRVIINERAILRQWAKHLGGLRLDQIRKVHVLDYRTKRLKAGKSARTVNLDVIVLRNVLHRAIEESLLSALPIAGQDALKVTSVKRQLSGPEVFDALAAAAVATRSDGSPVTKNGVQFADYLRFLQYSGCREKEALRIRWADVDLDRGQLSIGSDGDTKNSQGRTVDFNPKLQAHLRDMSARRAPDTAWLFPSPQRGDRDRPARSLRESLLLVRAAARCPKFGFHDARHFFISYAVMSGVDFMTIARWVGHQDGGILIGKVYGHIADAHRKTMAAQMNFGPVALVANA
jgi:integrase